MSVSSLHLFELALMTNFYDINDGICPGKLFLILNLERMVGCKPVFWKSGSNGYTDNVMLAGIYSKAELDNTNIGIDDLVVGIERLSELLTCDREVLKEIAREHDAGDFIN